MVKIFRGFSSSCDFGPGDLVEANNQKDSEIETNFVTKIFSGFLFFADFGPSDLVEADPEKDPKAADGDHVIRRAGRDHYSRDSLSKNRQ